MAALVTHTFAQSGDGNAVTTSPGVDTSTATLLVGLVTSLHGLGAMADSKSNTWAAGPVSSFGAGGHQGALYYVRNPTAVGSGHTFTGGSATSYCSVFVQAFSGTDTTVNHDRENTATATSTTLQTGSVTPSVDNEVLVAFLGVDTVTTYSINLGFTITDQAGLVSGKAYGGALAYLLQGAATATNPTWTASGSTALAVGIATFEPGVGAPGSTALDHDGMLFQYTQTARRITI